MAAAEEQTVVAAAEEQPVVAAMEEGMAAEEQQVVARMEEGSQAQVQTQAEAPFVAAMGEGSQAQAQTEAPIVAMMGEGSQAQAQAEAPFVAAMGEGSQAQAPFMAAMMPKPKLAYGFKFHPTDEELVVYFLRRKVLRRPFPFEAIAEVDIYNFEPWELQGFCAVNSREAEWHFFTRTEKKYINGSKINRATINGFWKATGRDRAVHHKSQIVGLKKTLVYHAGRAPAGRRTDWLMHEYRLSKQELEKAGVQQKDAYFICKVYLKKDAMGRRGVPFNVEDWENHTGILIPCEDNNADEDEASEVNLQGASTSKAVQLPEKAQGFKSLRIRAREEDDDETEDDEAIVCLDKGKKPKLMLDFFSGAGKGGSDDDSSSATISDSPTPEFSSGLLNFSLTAKPKEKENHGSAAPNNAGGGPFNSSCLENSLPPGYLKFITDLEEERDGLKHELMNSEATVSCLQAENEEMAEEIMRLRSLLPGQGFD
ncbi:NAC domain containing protein 50-like [Ipomoea triloba]|uniref:NAC domain containing protein 50-like n=1 Tax=Ipomoea triloba TaxID=35885 RepID=UPI00125D3823|nr:NAC domain containing protein 50-like [Ipomoea triloba]